MIEEKTDNSNRGATSAEKLVNEPNIKKNKESFTSTSEQLIEAGEKKEGEEEYVHSVWLKKFSFRIALLSMFSALAVVLGYTLAGIPNVELFTLMIFLGGFIMGYKEGVLIGLLSSSIFIFFNPYGVSPLPLLTYQIIHYGLVGLAGALTHWFLKNKKYFKPKEDLYVWQILLLFAFIGAIITIAYDLISTVIGALVIYGNLDTFVPYFLSGIFFTTVHEVGNTLGFIFMLPGLIQLLHKLLY
ncbi:MAG: conserved membrane protein of unknown function [Promethearchaeota archaeon]|nr:MAG: conserved membrane protein of unknown function [Candidatus Lokiarchaeota archaeon]